MSIRYGLGFLLALAVLLAGSSFFFRSHKEEPQQELFGIAADPSPEDSKIKAQEAESIPDERGLNEQSMDGESIAGTQDETAEESESSLENVFMNLTQEMARRGYAKGLSNCIESQFRENQGIENPKDLDAMLKICDSQFQVDAKQSQQIKEVVLQAIAKAQEKPGEGDSGRAGHF